MPRFGFALKISAEFIQLTDWAPRMLESMCKAPLPTLPVVNRFALAYLSGPTAQWRQQPHEGLPHH